MCWVQLFAAATNGLLFAITNGIALYACRTLDRWPTYGSPDSWAAVPQFAWLITPVGIAYLLAPLSVLLGLFGVGVSLVASSEVKRCRAASLLCMTTGIVLLVDPTGAVEWFLD